MGLKEVTRVAAFIPLRQRNNKSVTTDKTNKFELGVVNL